MFRTNAHILELVELIYFYVLTIDLIYQLVYFRNDKKSCSFCQKPQY